MNKISTLSPRLASEYSASSTYTAGQYVLWHNAYWKCVEAISVPEEWTPGHWVLDDSPLDHKADLVDGMVPSSQLPAYVDDVLTFDRYEDFPRPGSDGKIYVAKDTNVSYRWSESDYIAIAVADYNSLQNHPSINGVTLTGSKTTKDLHLVERKELIPEWAANTQYSTTSAVVHEGKFYLCKTAHRSRSTWDGTKWEETTLDKVMEQYGRLTPIYADGGWSCNPSSVTHGYYGEIRDLRVVHINEWWNLQGTRVNNEQTVTITGVSYDSSAVELTFSDSSITPSSVSASRSYALYLVGYTLGSQSDKPLLAKDAYPISIGNGTKTVAYNATNYIDIGKDTTIRGSNTMAFGHSSTAGGDNAMAIGPNANVQTDNAMALGSNTTASGTQALAIGNGANASAYGQAEGLGATAATDGTAIGFQAHANSSGVAIGAHAEINGGESIAIGHNAFATANNAGQIGPGTNNTADTLKFRDVVVVGPNGDVAPLKRHKLDLAVYELGNASVTFPAGFKVEGNATYTAPSGGETIEFFGPIPGTGNFDYWVPEAYKDYGYFDLEEVSDAWFLFDSAQETDMPTPNIMAFGYYSPGYSLAGWGSLSPVLTIAEGSESGGHPSMARPIVPTGDTIAALGDIPRPSTVIPQMDRGNGSAGGPSQYPGQYARADHVHPSDTSKLDVKEGTLHEKYSDDWTVSGQLPQGMKYTSGPTWQRSNWILELWSGYAPALIVADGQPTQTAVSLTFYNGAVTAVRDSASVHEMKGYRLGKAYGTNADKPLQPAGDYALKASPATAGNLASLDVNGNPTDSGLSRDDVEGLFFAQYYPDGSIKSAAEFTQGINYDTPDTVNRTITVKPFCNTGTASDDNSSLAGRVVIPPFVDAQYNPHISDDGTRYRVVGIGTGVDVPGDNSALKSIIAPTTVLNIGVDSFRKCISLASAYFPEATSVGSSAFRTCSSLKMAFVPKAQNVNSYAFRTCSALKEIYLPECSSIDQYAFNQCSTLQAVNFGRKILPAIPSLANVNVFSGVPTSCKIIVPDAQYDAWKAAQNWSDIASQIHRHSELYAPLAGKQAYDLSLSSDVTRALGDIITALGGTVTQ